ncbi:hypothetical protein GA0074692_1117 [Micromonospora pallida]|uniref:Uncharacterized protein n=1 Tax=Micromonospora pallida TaxID=145854 RepID=A0A1C6RW03_9ACTN|nr:hypothetical protein [Micromonospora pallida]SCL21210.1 hypothetical protein GA0074692_1117 [Micromonospora pallida]
MLGEVTCPSGDLILMDGGYLGLWSGDRSPEETRGPDAVAAVDFEVVGRDAETAARSFDHQSGLYLYDIPQHGVQQVVAKFGEHCRERGLDASLRPYTRQVPHRDRARRALTAGDPDFLITGVPVVPVGDVPSDRPLRVTASPSEWGWRQIRIELGTATVGSSRRLGSIYVDHARLVFADADALSSWVHDDSIDGLADVAFWGRDEELIATELGASRTGTPGDDNYGWLDLPIQQAYERAVALNERRSAEPRAMFAFDFRPHSHHWQVMAGVRAAEYEAATITVGGAEIMMAMTSIGDGVFPVHLDLDASGVPTAVRITVDE